MFCDYTEIRLEAGRGGGGSMSFRREKYIPKGGPDGGNGGKGASIFLEAVDNKNSLIDLHTRKLFKANNGESGTGWNKNGAAAEDLIIKVPVGTTVSDLETGEVLADLVNAGDMLEVVQGGIGGKGNANFKSSVRQAPRFAELGEPGETRDISLELKLVADVGLIGYPSVGKSTLISMMTNAKVKIADYPFTTLIPNLGIAKYYDESLVIADIPGLIEGASEGKGLGDEFLRHVSRNAILVHVLDFESEDIADDYFKIRKELKNYSSFIEEKTEIVIVNKADMQDLELEKMIADEFKKKTGVNDLLFVSATNNRNLDTLLSTISKKLSEFKKEKKETESKKEYKIYTPHLEEDRKYFKIQELKSYKDQENPDIVRRVFQIEGKRINQIAIMTDLKNYDALDRLWDVFDKYGIWRELEKLGATEQDRIVFTRFENKIAYREKI